MSFTAVRRVVDRRSRFTVSQRVGMVAWYSYIVMVKPGEQREEVLNLSRYFGRTINFVILFHIDKRVVVCVTVEMHIRPTNFVSANSDSQRIILAMSEQPVSCRNIIRIRPSPRRQRKRERMRARVLHMVKRFSRSAVR